MRSLIDDSDFNRAVCIIEKRVSTYLINTMLIKDLGEEFYSLVVENKKMNKRAKCEFLVEERQGWQLRLFLNGCKGDLKKINI